jgi:hypothetical protein
MADGRPYTARGTLRLPVIQLAAVALWFCSALSITGVLTGASTDQPRLLRVHRLEKDETVFAYARISPSGELLAYSSEQLAPDKHLVSRTEVVVDLSSGRTVWSTPGIDGYWSNDGTRLIFLALGNRDLVSVWDRNLGRVIKDVAPVSLGDYFSWAALDGRDLVMTILGNYYFLRGDVADLPAGQIRRCPQLEMGSRPLVSKDGLRVTTFQAGNVVVRDVFDCQKFVDTGLRGAKADFSWDGRYIAFHSPKPDLTGYEISVVDLEKRTVRTLSGLSGSSLFPSWTRDGRLCFMYDGDEYRGFILASDMLALPERLLPVPVPHRTPALSWQQLFPGTPERHALSLVAVWSGWSAHVPDLLADLEALQASLDERGIDVGIETVLARDSRPSRLDDLFGLVDGRLAITPLAIDKILKTGAINQIPCELLFINGRLVGEQLGPRSYRELEQWISDNLGLAAAVTPGVRGVPADFDGRR